MSRQQNTAIGVIFVKNRLQSDIRFYFKDSLVYDSHYTQKTLTFNNGMDLSGNDLRFINVDSFLGFKIQLEKPQPQFCLQLWSDCGISIKISKNGFGIDEDELVDISGNNDGILIHYALQYSDGSLCTWKNQQFITNTKLSDDSGLNGYWKLSSSNSSSNSGICNRIRWRDIACYRVDQNINLII